MGERHSGPVWTRHVGARFAARIDKEVYDWLMKYGKGYSTRINGILRTVMEANR
jgi:uncharacterized protein (DUF4415 family)